MTFICALNVNKILNSNESIEIITIDWIRCSNYFEQNKYLDRFFVFKSRERLWFFSILRAIFFSFAFTSRSFSSWESQHDFSWKAEAKKKFDYFEGWRKSKGSQGKANLLGCKCLLFRRRKKKLEEMARFTCFATPPPPNACLRSHNDTRWVIWNEWITPT